jgi:hypothetical protein
MTKQIGWFEAVGFVLAGIALALVAIGVIDPLGMVIVLVLLYFAWMARGVITQAQKVRAVEPARTWLITLVGNLFLMALGIGSFGWYLVGGSVRVWVPFLLFIAGMMALRWWRRGAVATIYAWRVPALTLLQQGEYKKLIRHLDDASGHPEKLAMLALAYIELNKWDVANNLLMQAQKIAPDFASVNGALGSLRRHQARYDEAIEAQQRALKYEENSSTRFYLGQVQYFAGQHDAARATLLSVIDLPDLTKLGQVYGAFMLGQIAEESGDSEAARRWYDRMAEGAPKILPALDEEWHRHKQTPYGDTVKEHVRTMEKIIARRPLAQD